MSERDAANPTEGEQNDTSELTETTPVTSAYKVLGEFSDGSGVAVLGQNNASNGTPIGVRGVAPDGYGLYTDGNALVGGLLDVGTLKFVDSASDGAVFFLTEDAGTGELAVKSGSTRTHTFSKNGNLTIEGEFTENNSLLVCPQSPVVGSDE